MADIIQTRRDIAANWSAVNPILADGEKGSETDTGQEKIGDGVSVWTLLPYISAGGGGLAAVVDDLTPQLGGSLDINGFTIFSVANSEDTNDIDIIAGSTNYDNDESQASGINLVGGNHLTDSTGPGKGGGITLTGGSLLDSVNATPSGYGGGIDLTGGNVVNAAEAWGGSIVIKGGDSYAQAGTSIAGRIHLKAGEAYDFPGDIWLEPGGSEGLESPAYGMVVIRASLYAGALGNYGGDERTGVLAFEGLQSNTTLGLNSERIKDNFIGIRAPDNVPAAYVLRLPAAPPSGAGEVLTTDTLSGGARNLVWAAGGGGGGVSNPLTADLVTGGFDIRGASDVLGQTVNIRAGDSSAPGNYGGGTNIYGGNAAYSGGSVRLVGGNTSGAYAGGQVVAYGGSPLGTVGNGGQIALRGADGGSVSGSGGDILLAPGAAEPGSSRGAIVIPDNIVAPLVTTNKMYNEGGDLYWDGVALNGQGGGTITGAYRFSTSVAVAPTAGQIRFNNATLGSVTEIFISQTTDNGIDALNFLNSLSVGNQIYVQDQADAADFAVWEVASAVTDEGSWFRVPVTLVNGGDAIANNNKTSVSFLYSSGTASAGPIALNPQVGVTYTAVLSDAEKMITLNNAAAIAMTIPANASVAYPVGTQLNFMQLGAGQVTVGITSDTLNVEAALTLKLTGQFAVATALKVSATEWTLFGNLEAA